jgi:hypothetical protein
MFHSIFVGRGAGAVSSCPYAVQNTDLLIGSYYTYTGVKPFYGLYNYSISASIYTQSQVGAGKQITGLQVYARSFTTPYTVLNQEIWIGEITNSTFPTTTPAVDFSDLTFVSGKPLTKVKASFTFTVSSNYVWINVNFDTPYCYEGTNNLILVWKNYDGSWQSGFGDFQAGNVVSRGMYKGNDPSFPTGNGTRDNYPLLVKFNY